MLSRPLIARVATNGPTIRPVWYLWEDGAFWWLTGPWSRLGSLIDKDPSIALLIDTWEPDTGEVLQVIATGNASTHPFDADRARRKLTRYLGGDESRWDRDRFIAGTFENPSVSFIRLYPDRIRVKDLSYRPPTQNPTPAGMRWDGLRIFGLRPEAHLPNEDAANEERPI